MKSVKSIRWAAGNKPESVATELATFISGAKHTLHIAIYDFRLTGSEKTAVVDAIKGAAQRGLEVRIAFDHTKANGTTAVSKATPGNDPAPRGTMQFVQEEFPKGSHVQTKPIAGSHLMHSKYVIRDGHTNDASVWMGSANFTNDAWSEQENNVLLVHSAGIAQHYETDFAELWSTGNIQGTGLNDYGATKLDADSVEFGFSPGEGSAVASLFVDAIQGAKGAAVYIASMVLSSGPILGALVDHLRGGGTIEGIYDATQMKGVETDWKKLQPPSPKLASWEQIKTHLVGKHSTPFTPTSVHDFMHNKLLVTEKVILTGSFNLSRNAESNAENVLAIHDPALAKQYTDYIRQLVAKYSAK